MANIFKGRSLLSHHKIEKLDLEYNIREHIKWKSSLQVHLEKKESLFLTPKERRQALRACEASF